MSNEIWKCSCGNENEGNFCSKCGREKNSSQPQRNVEAVNEQFIKLQMQQQEMLNAQKEERVRALREYDSKLKEYNEQSKLVPVKILKSWAGSWIVLVLSILACVSTACSLISLFTNLSSGWFKILVACVKLLLNCLLCIGFWRSYIMGRSKELRLDVGGVKMLNGVLKFYQVIVYLVMILIISLFIVAFIGMESCMGNVNDTVNAAGGDISQISAGVTGVLVAMLIILIAVFAVLIFYFVKATGFAKTVISFMNNNMTSLMSYTTIAVLFFIVGGFKLIGAIGTVAAGSALKGLFEGIKNVGNIVSGLNIFGKVDIADMLAQLSNAGMYIFGGILVLSFNGLSDKVFEERKLLEKPERPN